MVDTIMVGLGFIGYLIGSIPSGFLIARLHGIKDIRDYGSGNIGATNVARVLGLKYFFVVLFVDFSKAYGYLTGLYCCGYSQMHVMVAAFFLLMGNAYPIFLQLRGGKGASTTVGVLLALQPALVVYSCICWLIALAVSKTVGVASMVTLFFISVYACLSSSIDIWMALFIAFVGAFGLYLHRANLRNFLYKTESF